MMGKVSTIIYACILIISLGLAILLGNSESMVLFVILLMAPVADMVGYYLACTKIDAEIEATTAQLKKGIEIPVNIYVKNPTPVPIVDAIVTYEVKNNFYTESIVEKVNVPILAFVGQRITTSITPDYCGCYTIRIKEVEVWDAFHIKSFKKELDTVREILIMPEGKHAFKVDAGAFVTGTEEAEESQTKGSDFPEVQNVREYIPGDRLKDIHWKLSTKMGELMVKEHVSMSASQIIIVLEVEDDGAYNLDNLMDVAYSLGKIFLEQNMSHTLCWWSLAQSELVKVQITNKGQLLSAFEQLMYEAAAPVGSMNAKTNFAYEEHFTEQIVWLRLDDSRKNIEDEEILFLNKVLKASICSVDA